MEERVYQDIQNKDQIHVLHLKLITLLNSMFNPNSQNKRDQLLPIQMRNSTDLHLKLDISVMNEYR